MEDSKLARKRGELMKRLLVTGGAGFIGQNLIKATPQALSNVIQELLEDESIRTELGNNAQSWIVENRTWKSVTLNITSMYEKLVGK